MATFYDLFVQNAERYPSNIALEIQRGERTESYSYADARKMAESVGRWLLENRFEAGTRAVILADNHPRWVTTYLGIIAAGCVAVPLDTAFHADQVAKLLKDSGTALVFSDRKHLKLVQEASQGLTVGILLMDGKPESQQQLRGDLDSMFAAGAGDFKPVAAKSDAAVGLLYTSGTTADPKGVMLTHANMLGEVDAVLAWVKLGPEDALLGVLPLFHVLSQMANILMPLVVGGRCVYLETLNTTELLRGLRERKITAFAVVPQFFYLIHDSIFKKVEKKGWLFKKMFRAMLAFTRFTRRFGWNPGKLWFGKIHETFGGRMRYLVTGGSRFEPQIQRDFYSLGIDVMQAYGLTETTAAAFVTPVNDIVIGSVGPAMRGVEGKIVDPQPQEEGPPVGEIAIRGAVVMKGYWNRPDATAASLKDGWLHTGDLGYFDSRGNLFITGRKKELIVLANGKNIYPEEIEAHYLKSPYIKEIAVMALESRPGDPTSEHLHAVVVPNFEELKHRKIVNSKEVIRFDIEGLSAQLASTKRIGSYEIWQDDLPRTTTRKLKRFEIEKRVRANQGKSSGEPDISAEQPLTEEEETWLELPEVQRAVPILREASATHPEVIRPKDNLELDLGLDSMRRVELLVSLENELGGDVEESRLAEMYTVRDLVDAVRESAASGKTSRLARAQFAGWKAVLQEDPTDPEILKLAKPQPIAETFWFRVSRVAQMISYDSFKLKVTGLEKIPAKGPFILSSNHQSFLDPVVLGSLMPWPIFKDLFSVGTSEIFGSGFMRRLAGWLRVVVLDPDANLLPAMRAGAFGLKHGRVLMLYPEGERSIDGPPKTFKKGAAILSIHMQVPIVPVAIEGFHDAWPRGKTFQGFKPLKMKFGDALYPPPESAASEQAYEKLTAELRAKVLAMWEELGKEASTGLTGSNHE